MFYHHYNDIVRAVHDYIETKVEGVDSTEALDVLLHRCRNAKHPQNYGLIAMTVIFIALAFLFIFLFNLFSSGV